MRKGWIVMAVAGILAGCGGGGNGTGAQESGQLASNTSFVAAKPMAGDYFTWEYSSREQGGTVDANSYTTRSIRSVAADGAVSADYLYDYINPTSPLSYTSATSQVSFDIQGRWLGSSSTNCSAAPNPPFYLVAPNAVTVGLSWQSAGVVQSKCSYDSGSQFTFAYQDTVFTKEQVTVPAGTFNALKVAGSASEEDASFLQRSEHTCWWEPDLGIDVKCVTNITMTNKATGEIRSRVSTGLLRGYSKQKLGRKMDTELRFLGNWTGHYEGVSLGQNVSGNCELMVDGGNINGSCTGASVEFNISGTVRADGALSFTASNNRAYGATFAGKFDNLQQMSGNWTVPNVGSGSWVLTQD